METNRILKCGEFEFPEYKMFKHSEEANYLWSKWRYTNDEYYYNWNSLDDEGRQKVSNMAILNYIQKWNNVTDMDEYEKLCGVLYECGYKREYMILRHMGFVPKGCSLDE